MDAETIALPEGIVTVIVEVGETTVFLTDAQYEVFKKLNGHLNISEAPR